MLSTERCYLTYSKCSKNLNESKIVTEKYKILSSHQFGFRNNNTTYEQVRRISVMVEKALEHEKVFSTVILEVAQTLFKSYVTYRHYEN